MNFDLLFSGGAVFLLLLVSAFFSGSETSVTGSSMLRMHTLAQQGNHRAMLVKKLWDDKESLIGAILLGNNFVNILASSLATSILIQFFGQAGIAYATFGMTMLVVIFAEIMPKTYALNQPDSTAPRREIEVSSAFREGSFLHQAPCPRPHVRKAPHPTRSRRFSACSSSRRAFWSSAAC